jgi:Txe/YoeB family toxin of Txe-Axe toxin-antitoxin module
MEQQSIQIKILRILSFLIILTGIISILNSSLKTIVGNVINEGSNLSGSILGLALIIGGLVLFLASKKGGGGDGLVKIISTKRFEKSIKRQPKDDIERALEKLGTGLANEEFLKYEDKWSIRVNKGARILYDRNPKEITLYEYVPSSEHR